MHTVPKAVLVNLLLPLCADTAFEALQLRLLNRAFAEAVIQSGALWKHVFLTRWPLQHANLKFSDWHAMYKRRHEAVKQWNIDEYSVQPIEGCHLVFRCPMRWNDLRGEIESFDPEPETPNPNDPYNEDLDSLLRELERRTTRRRCHECDRFVYMARNEAEAKKYIGRGECIALAGKERPFDIDDLMGVMVDDFEYPSLEPQSLA